MPPLSTGCSGRVAGGLPRTTACRSLPPARTPTWQQHWHPGRPSWPTNQSRIRALNLYPGRSGRQLAGPMRAASGGLRGRPGTASGAGTPQDPAGSSTDLGVIYSRFVKVSPSAPSPQHARYAHAHTRAHVSHTSARAPEHPRPPQLPDQSNPRVGQVCNLPLFLPPAASDALLDFTGGRGPGALEACWSCGADPGHHGRQVSRVWARACFQWLRNRNST